EGRVRNRSQQTNSSSQTRSSIHRPFALLRDCHRERSGYSELFPQDQGDVMSSQRVIDAEGLESPKRNGSRYNAVTHGFTAKTVLPGEDPVAYQAKVDLYKSSLETRTPLEDELAEKAAMASWQFDRATEAETARLSRN